jgi:hypothetical protein
MLLAHTFTFNGNTCYGCPYCQTSIFGKVGSRVVEKFFKTLANLASS